jgi:hypothetical protein
MSAVLPLKPVGRALFEDALLVLLLLRFLFVPRFCRFLGARPCCVPRPVGAPPPLPVLAVVCMVDAFEVIEPATDSLIVGIVAKILWDSPRI